jgi:hypothetical protein
MYSVRSISTSSVLYKHKKVPEAMGAQAKTPTGTSQWAEQSQIHRRRSILRPPYHDKYTKFSVRIGAVKMTLFPSVSPIETENRKQWLHMQMLTGATVLVLSFGIMNTASHLQNADDLSFNTIELPSLSHIMEWRPQGPPPWMDWDQFNADEAEPAAHKTAGDREIRGRDAARARAER